MAWPCLAALSPTPTPPRLRAEDSYIEEGTRSQALLDSLSEQVSRCVYVCRERKVTGGGQGGEGRVERAENLPELPL